MAICFPCGAQDDEYNLNYKFRRNVHRRLLSRGAVRCYDTGLGSYAGALESVSITMDNLATEFTTPHTFVDLIGTHNFTVPNSDSFGVPFGNWEETGWTSATITVGGAGGTHTARYYYPPITLQ